MHDGFYKRKINSGLDTAATAPLDVGDRSDGLQAKQKDSDDPSIRKKPAY
jgi:hypothetical protein